MGDSPKSGARRIALVVGAVAALAIGGVLLSASLRTFEPHTARPAGPAELALLAPLAPGAALADYTVREIHAIERGMLRVVCVHDAAVVQLDVALKGETTGRTAASSVGRYAIYYSIKNAGEPDGQRLAQALAVIIGTHADLPPPPGLTAFQPQQK